MTEQELHCLALVRAHDRDRYLSSLFAPDDKRKHLLALYAFNAEICRIPDLVTEPQIGEIRMQWWLDTLAAIAEGQAQDHPVAQALAKAKLPHAPLENLAKAHIFDLYADPMPSLNDLEGYLGETESALMQMAALILAGPDAAKASEAAGLAGVAYGLAKLNRKNLVPKDLTVDLGQHALQRLSEARDKASTIPQAALPAFLPCALTPALVRNKGDVSAWRRQWILWRAARAGRF